ncbi:MAG: type II toxin-antitoxin system prevent-host-death family antitoxin [Anaerolineaceae bacterium]|nr:type II toxin-antitoxin system prevent-host-death family antitoxin [Anaerolineaceae bacterium]
MISSWQLQEAKNKLSQLVDEAMKTGPQIITRRGVEVAIVLSVEEYRHLTASREKLSDFFRQSPLVDLELDLERDKSPARDVFTP